MHTEHALTSLVVLGLQQEGEVVKQKRPYSCDPMSLGSTIELLDNKDPFRKNFISKTKIVIYDR